MQFTVPAVSPNRVAAHVKQAQEDVCNLTVQARTQLSHYINDVYVCHTLINVVQSEQFYFIGQLQLLIIVFNSCLSVAIE